MTLTHEILTQIISNGVITDTFSSILALSNVDPNDIPQITDDQALLMVLEGDTKVDMISPSESLDRTIYIGLNWLNYNTYIKTTTNGITTVSYTDAEKIEMLNNAIFTSILDWVNGQDVYTISSVEMFTSGESLPPFFASGCTLTLSEANYVGKNYNI